MITAAELLRYLNIQLTAWATTVIYEMGQYVSKDGTVYECLLPHTAGVFADDLAALKWTADTFVLSCINQAIGDINSYCNRDLREGSRTEYLDGNGLSDAGIRNMPLKIDTGSVTALNYLDGDNGWQPIITGSGDTIENSIIKYTTSIKLLKGYTFTAGIKNIQITYTGGYAAASMPGDIKNVALEKAAWFYKTSYASGSGLLALGSQNTGGQSSDGKSFDTEALNKKHELVLNRYRIINI